MKARRLVAVDEHRALTAAHAVESEPHVRGRGQGELEEGATEAARALSEENEKVYLEHPFKGFFVTRRTPEQTFYAGEGFFLSCENLLGEKH